MANPLIRPDDDGDPEAEFARPALTSVQVIARSSWRAWRCHCEIVHRHDSCAPDLRSNDYSSSSRCAGLGDLRDR